MENELLKILNKYQSKLKPLHNEGGIDPMDFHKIVDEFVHKSNINNRKLLIDFMDDYRDTDGMGKRDSEAVDSYLKRIC